MSNIIKALHIPIFPPVLLFVQFTIEYIARRSAAADISINGRVSNLFGNASYMQVYSIYTRPFTLLYKDFALVPIDNII